MNGLLKFIAATMGIIFFVGAGGLPDESSSAQDFQQTAQAQQVLAPVEEVEVDKLGAAAVQVLAKGTFKNNCQSVDAYTNIHEGNKFIITISKKSDGKFCAQGLVPFAQKVSLNTGSLKAGTYEVVVNGVGSSFKI
jgi:hypothetical protein